MATLFEDIVGYKNFSIKAFGKFIYRHLFSLNKKSYKMYITF